MSAAYASSYEAQCLMKRTYRNSKAAKRAARQAMAERGGPAMNVYRCGWCARWHVGHASETGKKQLRQEAV